MKSISKEKIMIWLVVISTIIVPSSGYVLLGKSIRGLVMLFWMFVFGYITFRLTGEDISFIGRLSGGFAVWTLSVLEIYRLAYRRWHE